MIPAAPEPEALYSALLADRARLRQLHHLEYRCQNRCLLLDAVGVGGTVLLHQKRHKFSAGVNESRSSSAGRAANTSDGRNHWLPRTFFIENSALAYQDLPSATLAIQCDDVGVRPDGSEVALTAADFEADWVAGHSLVMVRKDGTRYPVH